VASIIKNILKLSMVAVLLPSMVFGAQQPNPRTTSVSRNDAASGDELAGESARRAATSVIARSVTQNKRQSRAVVTARPATVRSARPLAKAGNVARSASKSSFARSGTKPKAKDVNKSRAGVARATAVFNDVSKISGGYADCRDSYATCMDQMCANANDTYRRCFCSDRFTYFRDTSDRIDEAVKLLAEFQNVNLDAVNKTAEEVNAMYSATAGEEAIKRDTSAAQKLLDNVSDLLSGKKSTYKAKSNVSVTSLGVLDFSDFSSGTGDVFGDSSTSVFSTSSSLNKGFSTYNDISSLEGTELYNAAMQQCSQVSQNACSSNATFNLARSAYSILVTQDCNAYEKSLNAKKVSLQDTIRTAEKYLREARLAEYRAHNSQDVSECLSRVESAMQQANVCGENYGRCLDYSGLYINTSTGNPIYSQALFKLNDLIVLDGSADVVGANPKFDTFLEDKKIFAESALDTCRGIADTVWSEFKRVAIIEIAQAQDEKIEEVKASCVTTMKECYDTQTGALNDMAGDAAKSATKAISVVTARDMCKDKVFACAALYGDIDGCSYDDATKKISVVEGKKCGLQSLLAMVDAVDTVKFAKGCEESLREYAQETCTPSDGVHAYPWGCRKISPAELEGQLRDRASVRCANDFQSDYSISETNRFNPNVEQYISNVMTDVRRNMEQVLREECSDIETDSVLVFDANGYTVDTDDVINVSPTWMEKVFGTTSLKALVKTGVTGYGLQSRGEKVDKESGEPSFGWGVCMFPSVRQFCTMQGQLPGMSSTVEFIDGKCVLKSEWFNQRCKDLGGYMYDDKCWFLDGD